MRREIIFSLIFWLSLAVLFFTYIGYPIFIYCLAKLFRKASHQAKVLVKPTVTIVLAAYNEESRIVARLQNLLSSDYPADKLNIILVSDGATDTTVEKAKALQDRRIEVLLQPKRSGKAACLNAALSIARSEIIVFGDVRQKFSSDTITKLVAHFENPDIGAVSGSLVIESAGSAIGEGVDAYWKLEKFLRFQESLLDSAIGCTGAVYAMRRELFQSISEDTLLDDVVIPMQVALQNRRVIFEPTALAFDPQSLEPEREWIRKLRTLAGNYQMLFRHPNWLLPWCNRLWWQLLCHKYLRLFAPWFMILMFLSNLALYNEPFYRFIFWGHCAFYLLALCGRLFPSKKFIFFSVPSGFVFLNLTAACGLWHYLRRPSQPGWQTAHVKAEQKKYV